jgi:uncharacterized Tic20 family protein
MSENTRPDEPGREGSAPETQVVPQGDGTHEPVVEETSHDVPPGGSAPADPPPPAAQVPQPAAEVPPPPPAAATPEAAQAPPPPPPPGAWPGGQPPQQPYPVAAYAPPSGSPMTPADERTTGLAAHGVGLAATVLSGGVLGFVATLVMYLVFKDRGPFVRAHTANALNVQIIVGIVFLVSIPLMFVLIGFLTFAAAWIFAVIVHIIGMVKANNGEWWDPPLTPKFVS